MLPASSSSLPLARTRVFKDGVNVKSAVRRLRHWRRSEHAQLLHTTRTTGGGALRSTTSRVRRRAHAAAPGPSRTRYMYLPESA